jgi:hypothetical protein
MPLEIALLSFAGAAVGGLFTLASARVGHRWERARRDATSLADQVRAFYALEQEYMVALHEADPELGAPRTIQIQMRDRVMTQPGFCRPDMTSSEAARIADRYQ